MAFLRWCGLGLPTEPEWEKALRGGFYLDGDETKARANPLPERNFPWGNEAPGADGVYRCNFDGDADGFDPVAGWSGQIGRLVEAVAHGEQPFAELVQHVLTEAVRLENGEPIGLEIGSAVEEALTQGRHLLVRAPTGCGKTAAVLHPVVRAALGRGQRVFFLTAKTLQQRIAVETARSMQDGLFRSLQLRAKSKMCANTEIVCHEAVCP